MYRPHAKLSIVSWILHVLNIQWWHLIYICIYYYKEGKICNDITPTNSHTKWEDYMKANNYIKNDCYQETVKGYSIIVQIIMKNDHGKAIA